MTDLQSKQLLDRLRKVIDETPKVLHQKPVPLARNLAESKPIDSLKRIQHQKKSRQVQARNGKMTQRRIMDCEHP
jgi:hypothetical protein